MTCISCSVPERLVNPLFEVFDGGELILSSYRDVEESFARMRIYFDDPSLADPAKAALSSALEIVGYDASIEESEIPDEDWKFAYRHHFKIEEIGRRLITVPAWEKIPATDRVALIIDPGMAFGTGKHETTRACLEYIDECLTSENTFLDMGSGSGILSIAAAKLGCRQVAGFDVDQDAVDASIENAAVNGVKIDFFKYALGGAVRRDLGKADFVVANILGPLLIRFSGEITSCVGDKLVLSGILNELYDEVRAEYCRYGLKEISRKVIGEWTTGLFALQR